MKNMENLRYCQHEKESYTWWEYDQHGIELCKVCDRCAKVKLATYRSYDATEETIEPEPDVSYQNI